MITAKKFNFLIFFYFPTLNHYILPFSFKSRKKQIWWLTLIKIWPSRGSVTQTCPRKICSPGGQQITQSFSIIHFQHLPSSNILKNFTLIEIKYCTFDPSDYRELLNSSFTLASGGYNHLIMRILSGPASSWAYRQPFIVNHIKIRNINFIRYHFE